MVRVDQAVGLAVVAAGFAAGLVAGFATAAAIPATSFFIDIRLNRT